MDCYDAPAMLTLYGTTTSPFVRRVRIVAEELGVEHTLVDVGGEQGQAELRALTPVWKVPAAVWHGEALLDSHLIIERLLAEQGPSGLRRLQPFDPSDTRARNALTVIDGATDALINLVYLSRDGLGPEQSTYLRKHHDRASAALGWLDAQMGPHLGPAPAPIVTDLSVVEIALVTSLEWMVFRDTYPVGRHANLAAIVAIHAERPSFVHTRPGA